MTRDAGAEVALGILDRDDPRMLGELEQRLDGDRRAGAARDVVQHVRQAGGVGDLLEVRDQTALRRLVVVRRHD